MNEKRIKMKTRNVSVGHGCLLMTKSHNSCKTCSIEKPVGDAHTRFWVVHAYIRTDVQRSANLNAHPQFCGGHNKYPYMVANM